MPLCAHCSHQPTMFPHNDSEILFHNDLLLSVRKRYTTLVAVSSAAGSPMLTLKPASLAELRTFGMATSRWANHPIILLSALM